jgi:diapolycopene oxygenase
MNTPSFNQHHEPNTDALEICHAAEALVRSRQATQVAIIGGGLGGLSAAIAMASEGCSVELFEKNDSVGGKVNVLQTNGFCFDLGPSTLTMPQVFESLCVFQ